MEDRYPRLKTKEREAVLNHWASVHERYGCILDFITQFCNGRRIDLVQMNGEDYYTTSLTKLLDEYFEVDQKKLEYARRDILDKHVIDTEKNRCTSKK